MKKVKLVLVAVLVVTLFMSCSQALIGTWKVQKYENTIPGEQLVTLNNIGTFSFNRDGTGEKDISYTVFDFNRTDNNPFNWTIYENYISIISDSSEFAKTWIRTENKKDYQYWKSTDGENRVQALELKKVK
ncbi:MAG: hypothetical protein PHE33_06620 [Bacteroidales bacterium]|nr:hypothetical protein [Bacteroidales bacterium]